MEKKGNLLTQLALISDLFERANMESRDTDVSFSVSADEFDRLVDLINQKANTQLVVIDDTFQVRIGTVEYIFNKNSV